jgi:hypothetical protein
MSKSFVVAAQVSTASLPPGAATAEWVLRAVERVIEIAPLDILIVGGRESPDLYRALTAPGARYAGQVFLWYDLLSDYPGMAPEESVIGFRGRPAPGWSEVADVDEADGETFRFACPNNPAVRRKTLKALDRLLDRYTFDGVFLDKLRFPSPANGPEGLFSCFCSECRRAAAAAGLDLDEVQAALAGPARASAGSGDAALPRGAPWLEALLGDQPVLRRFVRFRADSVTALVNAAQNTVANRGRALALDLFSPGLALLVGQDYPALARYAAWGKPMTYPITRAPAGLRLEAPALIRMLAARLGMRAAEALAWAARYAPGLDGVTLSAIEEEGLPVEAILHELRRAVELLAPAPIYMGLETVSFPDICEAAPGSIARAVAAGRQAGVSGLVMSWDLLDTPLENVRATARAIA